MNKKLTLIVVGVLVLLATGFYFYCGRFTGRTDINDSEDLQAIEDSLNYYENQQQAAKDSADHYENEHKIAYEKFTSIDSLTAFQHDSLLSRVQADFIQSIRNRRIRKGTFGHGDTVRTIETGIP